MIAERHLVNPRSSCCIPDVPLGGRQVPQDLAPTKRGDSRVDRWRRGDGHGLGCLDTQSPQVSIKAIHAGVAGERSSPSSMATVRRPQQLRDVFLPEQTLALAEGQLLAHGAATRAEADTPHGLKVDGLRQSLPR